MKGLFTDPFGNAHVKKQTSIYFDFPFSDTSRIRLSYANETFVPCASDRKRFIFLRADVRKDMLMDESVFSPLEDGTNANCQFDSAVLLFAGAFMFLH